MFEVWKQEGRVKEKLSQRVTKTADGHWLWNGSKLASGHGRVRFEGKMQPAHRVFFIVFNGPIPEGFYVKQVCQIKLCVNPECLKAEAPVGPFGLKFKVPTVEDVAAIRIAYRENKSTLAELAERFGVSTHHVTRIGKGTYRIGREKK